jgi:hypothetical protein
MANVTVLGASGATVTIALTSGENAGAAQTAANFINSINTFGILDQQTWSGSGTLPAPSNLLGGAIISKAGDVGALSAQYVSVMVNAVGESTVVGPENATATVIAGDGADLTFLNLSAKAEVFFGANDGTLINQGGVVNMRSEAGTHVVLSDAGSTVNTFAGDGLILFADIDGKSGTVTANITAGSKNATIIASGDSTVPVTINATTGEFVALADEKANMIVNPGQANATLIGANKVGAGATTLFGGTGSVVVSDGQGIYTGGSAGDNLMFTGTVPGSATLTGGGTGDLLFAAGADQLLIAGGGASTLLGRWVEETSKDPGVFVEQSTGGHRFLVGAGFTTVFGAQSGGNTFLFAGLGSALVEGRDEDAEGQAQNTYFDFTAFGGTHLISDFQAGLDKLQYAGTADATIEFFTAGSSELFGAAAGTRVITPGGTTFLFFDTGSDGIQDITASDIVKL